MNILQAIKFLKKGKSIFRLEKPGCLRLTKLEGKDPYGNPTSEEVIMLHSGSTKQPYVLTKSDLNSDKWMVSA